MTCKIVKLGHPRDEAETALNELAAQGSRLHSWFLASHGVWAVLDRSAAP
jgi:hypothetical protein